VDADDLLDSVGELSDAAEALRDMMTAGEMDPDQMAQTVESITEAIDLLGRGHAPEEAAPDGD
jgi:hypothetical protein